MCWCYKKTNLIASKHELYDCSYLEWIVLVDLNCNIYFRANMTCNLKLIRTSMTYNPNKRFRAHMTYKANKRFCANMTYNPNIFSCNHDLQSQQTSSCKHDLQSQQNYSCEHDTSELQPTHNNEDSIDIRLSDRFFNC